MKVAVVSSSALGLNCWKPTRLVGSCESCHKYETCKFPERVANPEYDAIIEEARDLKAMSDAKYQQARDMRSGRKTPTE
jgi:hypothetical protein